MKKLKIPESLKGKVPKEFLKLDEEATYTLVKLSSKDDRSSMIGVGQFEVGNVSIVEVKHLGLPGILVARGFKSYIRTSPIVKVLETTDESIKFETEGGVYLLEKGIKYA